MKRLIISLLILTALAKSNPTLIAGTKYDSKGVIEKISKVKSKSELEKIFEENNQIPFGEVDSNILYLKIDFGKAVDKRLKDESLKAIIAFLSDKNMVKKYNLGGVVNNTIVIVIKSSHYTQAEKEFVVKSLDTIPDYLSDLKDYFLKPENQNNQLFKKYLDWCNQSYFFFIYKIFDKLNLEDQMEAVRQINPFTKPRTKYKKKIQIPFLKKVASSDLYDENLRKLAKEQLNLFSKEYREFILGLSNVSTKGQVEEILKKYNKRDEYSIIEKLLFHTKSIEVKKAILEYLSENCELESEKIGNIFANVVVSPKLKNELKKMAMSQDAFTYNENYRKNLCQYFSKKENQESSLYKQFIKFAVSESDQEESMEFILKFFDSFEDKEKLEITKSINLSYTGDLESQFEFFKKILKGKKYPDNLKKVAEDQLAKLEAKKKSFAEEMRPRSGKEMATACINGFEKLLKLKVIEPSRKGYVFSDEEKEMIKSLFKDVEKTLETYKSVYKLDDKTMREAQDKLKKIRDRIDSVLSKHPQTEK